MPIYKYRFTRKNSVHSIISTIIPLSALLKLNTNFIYIYIYIYIYNNNKYIYIIINIYI